MHTIAFRYNQEVYKSIQEDGFKTVYYCRPPVNLSSLGITPQARHALIQTKPFISPTPGLVVIVILVGLCNNVLFIYLSYILLDQGGVQEDSQI